MARFRRRRRLCQNPARTVNQWWADSSQHGINGAARTGYGRGMSLDPGPLPRALDETGIIGVIQPRMLRRNQTRVSLLTQAVASFAAVLVLALTVLAASPGLHRLLHGHEESPSAAANASAGQHGHRQAADDDDGCVVTLFAQGILLPLAAFALVFSGRILRLISIYGDDRVSAVAPGFLLLPSQAPPLG